MFGLLQTGIAFAQAPAFQPLADIENAASQFISKKVSPRDNVEVEIKVNSLDPRLHLAYCDQALQTYLPGNTKLNARVSVGVECKGKKPWKLYVPVTIARYANVYIAGNALMKGDKVTPEDLRLVRMDISKLRVRPMSDSTDIVGMLARRNISRGSVFSTRYLKMPAIIKKGDMVNIVASLSGINIRMKGKAMVAGARGERIQVRNSSSKRMVEAVVINASTVKVNL